MLRLRRSRKAAVLAVRFDSFRLFGGQLLADDCYRSEEMNNSANVKIEMTAEQIFKEIEALPRSERERLVQRMRESADSPQDFIDALDDFNQQRFVSMETALNETPSDA